MPNEPPTCVHYVGFRDDAFVRARRIFGGPVFIHRRWDLRARRDIGSNDLVVFAIGDENQPPSPISGNDLDEKEPT